MSQIPALADPGKLSTPKDLKDEKPVNPKRVETRRNSVPIDNTLELDLEAVRLSELQSLGDFQETEEVKQLIKRTS